MEVWIKTDEGRFLRSSAVAEFHIGEGITSDCETFYKVIAHIPSVGDLRVQAYATVEDAANGLAEFIRTIVDGEKEVSGGVSFGGY
jgi:hypothetical protein